MIELTIVIAIMLVMLGIGIQWYLTIGQRQEVENLIATETRELAQLKGAVSAYMKDNTNVSGWAADTRNSIGIQVLIDKGLLPAAFATRRGHLGESPFGQAYTIAGIKDGPAGDATVPDGRLRAVIYESSAAEPLASRMDRTGTANTDSGKQGLKALIAQVASTAGTISGVIPKGSSTATGNISSWTKDFSRWTQSVATTPQVVVPVGFTDIDPSVCIGPSCNDTPTVDNTVYENCQAITATCPPGIPYETQDGECKDAAGNVYNPISPTCPAGKVEVGRAIHCGQVASGTKIGPMTVGRYLRKEVQSNLDNYGPHQCIPAIGGAACDGKTNTYYDGVVTINAVEFARYGCLMDGWSTQNGFAQKTYVGWPGYGATQASSGYDVACCTTRVP